jgi:hypothetical protein
MNRQEKAQGAKIELLKAFWIGYTDISWRLLHVDRQNMWFSEKEKGLQLKDL